MKCRSSLLGLQKLSFQRVKGQLLQAQKAAFEKIKVCR